MENFKLSRKEANDLFRWISHPSMSPDAVLTMANSLLHGYGVESCRDERHGSILTMVTPSRYTSIRVRRMIRLFSMTLKRKNFWLYHGRLV